ncbi:MAG: hypothetical protein ACT4OJ_11945 [Bacteroidota bacterium]
MNSIVMPKTVQLTEETNTQLPEELKETPAKDAGISKKVKFTVVDMWNRQRNSRSASDRLRRWNLN